MPRRVLIICAAVLLFCFGVATGAALSSPGNSSVRNSLLTFTQQHSGTDFSQFVQIWDEIHTRYVEKDVNDQTLVQGAMQGLVSALGDPYSLYMNPKEAQDFQADIDGTFDGIGMEVGMKNDKLTVIAPLPGSPSEKAGLRSGDIIVAIDDKPTANMNLNEAVQAIRGPKDSTVRLAIQRGGGDVQVISVKRDTIKVSPVTSKLIDADGKKFAYIQVSSFNSDTTRLFTQQAHDLLTKSPAGFILDLRNNPGGLLDAAIQMGSAFIPNGTIVSEVGRDGVKHEQKAEGGAFLQDEHVVVLINNGSASAAEIVAGALQGRPHTTVVGEQSFGKGTVQDYENLDDGGSLKLTIAKWLTPKGVSIQKNGITPDVKVELTEDDFQHDRDPQLDRAKEILKTP